MPAPVSDGRLAYAEVIDRVAAVAQRLGGTLSRTGEADGYPLYHLELPSPHPGAPAVLLDAGLHGEEPGGVLGLLAWLEERAERWLPRLALSAFPCLNPWGYERGQRSIAAGLDLNRQFRDPSFPAVRMVRERLQGRRFALCIDCHEDCDFTGFYMYENSAGPQRVGERIVEAVSALGPVAPADPTGEVPVVNGLVRRGLTREAVAQREQWPIALYLFLYHTDHVLTLETPGRQPLPLRVRMQVTAIETALTWLWEHLGQPAGAGRSPRP